MCWLLDRYNCCDEVNGSENVEDCCSKENFCGLAQLMIGLFQLIQRGEDGIAGENRWNQKDKATMFLLSLTGKKNKATLMHFGILWKGDLEMKTLRHIEKSHRKI